MVYPCRTLVLGMGVVTSVVYMFMSLDTVLVVMPVAAVVFILDVVPARAASMVVMCM